MSKEQRRQDSAGRALAMPCEVFSRIVGYYRPVQQWNKGKAEEFHQREVIAWKEPLEKT